MKQRISRLFSNDVLFVLVLACLYIAVGLIMHYHPNEKLPCASVQGSSNCAFVLERVVTPEARELGLSGRESLGSDSAMLFEFKNAARQCIWMKDMKFSIDIVWIDKDGKVIRLAHNVSPASYPEQFCADNTTYVLETVANATKARNIVVGSVIRL